MEERVRNAVRAEKIGESASLEQAFVQFVDVEGRIVWAATGSVFDQV